MSRKQWGAGFNAGRKAERVNQDAAKRMPEVLDNLVGRGNWFRVQNRKLYVCHNPRYQGEGIGLLIVNEDGTWTAAELRQQVIEGADDSAPESA